MPWKTRSRFQLTLLPHNLFSDYPHSVTLWPNSQKHIEELTRDLGAAERDKVLYGNAASVYGFEA